MGHVHLRVIDVDETVAFYRDVLGFELMARLGAQAAFLAAGGYHHHLGANVWETAHPRPAPPEHARLLHATLVLPDAVEQTRLAEAARHAGQAPEAVDGGLLVRDPSGNALILAVED
jgi:catechol 2,3-dioxygenase